MYKLSKVIDITKTSGEMHGTVTDSSIYLAKLMQYDKKMVKNISYFQK